MELQNDKKGLNKALQDFDELGKLTGGLAHELKNPLSTVKLNLQLVYEDLQKCNPAETDRAAVEQNSAKLNRAIRKISVIRKETERLEHILESFLQYVAKTRLKTSPADINEIIGDMIDFYSPQADNRSIQIKQNLCRSPLICNVDANMLKQVFLNLFINAQQAMKDGGTLVIQTKKEKSDAVIKITDTGCGITPDKLPFIFDAYYSSRSQGSGLGLATAKRIIEAHNGRIIAQSEPEKGTTFTIKIPAYNQ